MSAEKAEPGDVFVTRGIKEIDWSRRLCVRGYMVEEEGGALKGLCDARDDLPTGFLFNLPALLAGDPFAWAAALRFAPEVFLAEVGEGEGKREVVSPPNGCDISAVEWFDPSLVADDSVTHFRAVATGLDVNGERHWNVHVNRVAFGPLTRHGKTFEEAARTARFAVNAALRGDEDAT